VNEVFISGLTQPMAITFTPDGRMLVSMKLGTIGVVQAGSTEVDPFPLLELTNINADGERGLSGIVLDPDFSSNGYLYLFYTANSPLRDRVSRFTAIGNTVDIQTEVVVWQDDVVSDIDHHGGSVAFGADGKLYISTGDHFDPPSSQRLDSYHGKILRINSDGTIPTDNPFFDGNGPNLDEIWALGLRNPFKFSIDRVTGAIYIGDVGGNDSSVAKEEVNLGGAGANYGWPNCEGTCSVPGTSNPLYFYPHNGRDASITGGIVYRGNQFPSEYYGSYFFADYAQNWIRRLTFDATGGLIGSSNFEPQNGTLDGPYGNPVGLAEGPDGSLYYVSFDFGQDGSFAPGSIRRIRYVPANQPPVVVASANPTSGLSPLTVSFSSLGSTDPEGQPLLYSWTFGDGGSSSEPTPTHVYQQDGMYTARLSVSDGVSSSLAAPINITVGNPPIPTILTPINGSTFRAGDVISFSAIATDPEGGPLPASAFSWTIVFRHDTHIHPALGPLTGITTGSFTIPNAGHDFSGNTRYEIILTVTDTSGLRNSTSVTVFPQIANLSFDSVPSGLNLVLDGIYRITPFTNDSLIGFQHTLNAPNQVQGGIAYSFLSWSDAGAQSHGIVVPETAQSYAAIFDGTPQPQPSGLVAGYAFDEGTGISTGDASGNGHTGSLTGGVTWTAAGKYGNALSFDGTTNWVTVSDSNLLDLTTGMTLMAWVYPTTTSGVRDILLKEGSNVDIYNLYARNWRGLPESNVFVGGTNRTAEGAALPANVWTHVAGTYDGTTLRLFINGVQAASNAVSGSITTSTGPLRIGGNSIWGEYFQGRIDEVRIYNRALNQAEIQTDLNTPIGVAPPQDTIPPTVTITSPTTFPTYSAGSTPLTLEGTAGDDVSVTQVTWASDRGGSGTASGTTTWSASGIPLQAGSNVLTVTAQDAAGNSQTASLTVTYTPPETTPPIGSLSINGNATYTSSTAGTLNLGATDAVGVTGYYLSTSPTTPSPTATGWVAVPATVSYSGTVPYTLPSGDATKTVYAWYKDEAGNVSTPASDSIILDQTTPSNGTLTATGQDTQVTLTWSGISDGGSGLSSSTPYKLVFRTGSLPSALCTDGTQLLLGSGTGFTHTGLTNGSTYFYRVCALDNAGNTSTGATASTTPSAADTTAPTGNLTINGNAANTNTTAVTLNLSSSDALAVTGYYLSTSSTPPLAGAAGWVAVPATTSFTSNVSYTLPGGDGTKTVYAWYKDAAGNVSGTASDSILLDQTLPSNGTLSATSGNAQIALSWSGVADGGSGLTSANTYKLVFTTGGSPNGSCTSGTQLLLGTATSYTHTGLTNGTTYSYRVCAFDNAGNTSTGATAIATPNVAPPPSTGLVAAYSFNAVSGTTAVDASGNGHTGSLKGGVTWTAAGKYGNALSFDGVNDYVSVASPGLPTGDYTWAAWVNPNQTSSFRAILVARGIGASPGGLELNLDTGGKIIVWSNGGLRLTSATTIPAGAWTHVALTRAGATLRLYVNGALDPNTGTNSVAHNFSTCPLLIGVDNDSGCTGALNGYFAGRLDEIRIYNRAFTASEIQADMNTPIP
jgi:glucose/arabinose dehydrogenase